MKSASDNFFSSSSATYCFSTLIFCLFCLTDLQVRSTFRWWQITEATTPGMSKGDQAKTSMFIIRNSMSSYRSISSNKLSICIVLPNLTSINSTSSTGIGHFSCSSNLMSRMDFHHLSFTHGIHQGLSNGQALSDPALVSGDEITCPSCLLITPYLTHSFPGRELYHFMQSQDNRSHSVQKRLS